MKQSIRFYNQLNLMKIPINKKSYHNYANQEKIKKILQELQIIKTDIKNLYEKPDYISFGLVKPELKEIKKKVSELKKTIKPKYDVLSEYYNIE